MRTDFVNGLKDLGFEVEELGGTRLGFAYTIPVGKFAGEKISLGFDVPDQFPATPPGGPHVSPRLLPLHPDQSVGHPSGGVHESNTFGEGWEYWSRPFPEWEKTDRSVRAYMAHIRKLFETQ